MFVTALRLLLALAVLAVAAAPAQARVYSVIPADAVGPNDAFLTNEILYAMGTNNALEGASDLCVVAAGSSDQGDCEEDATWGRPNAIVVQGTFPPQPIEGAPLPPGTWQILADNGDEDTDVVSAQFTVLPCAPGDECPTTIADAVMAQWKQAAAAARTGTGFACLNPRCSASGDGVQPAACCSEREGIMAEIKGDGVSVGFSRGSSIEKSVALLRSVSCGAFVMYDDIVADPPDPNYKDLVEPAPASVDTSLTTDPSVVAAVQALEETTAYGNAHRAGVERYQGAVLASDEGWAAAHASRVGEQALSHPAEDAPAGEPPARRRAGDRRPEHRSGHRRRPHRRPRHPRAHPHQRVHRRGDHRTSGRRTDARARSPRRASSSAHRSPTA